MNEEKRMVEELLNKSNSIKEDSIEEVIEKVVEFDISELDKPNEEIILDEINDEVKPRKKAEKIDPNNIKIVNSTELEKDMDLREALYGGKSMFQVIAAQSGYMAKVAPLVHKDIINLLYSNLSRYEYKKAVFRVIYDKIVAISTGKKMSFETWLKQTSVEDIETFYYGIYCATFPDEGKFTFTCPECDTERDMSIKHGNLFKTTDNERMKKLFKDISAHATSDEMREKFSLVGKSELFKLPDSGIIMEVRTPSLWDSLEILRVVPESVIDRDTLSVTNMLYVKKFLIPSKKLDGYSEKYDSQELLRIIDNLSIDDAAELQNIVSSRVDESRVSYSIKNVKCPNCGNTIDDTPISIEDILFTLIFEKAQ